MHSLLKSRSKYIVTLVVSGASVLVASMSFAPSASALSGNEFNPGRIIDDTVFYNANSMSSAQIQQFMEAKVPVCDTNGEKLVSSGQTRAQYGRDRGYPPPYTCLKDYRQNINAKNPEDALCSGMAAASNVRASEIIYRVAQSCGVSPKVLLVLLQKEQSLVTDDWPWSIQYRSATGYGCPDTAPCDEEYYGFYNQVYMAARGYKYYAKYPHKFNHIAGRNNYVLYNPNTDCGGTNVFIENQATAGLYNYTPYQPNAKALSNLYGTGDGCSAYGNRNFWRMFNDWFGSTEGTPFFKINGSNKIYMQGADDTYYYVPSNDIMEAYGFKRFITKILAFDSSYIQNQTNAGTLNQVARFEGSEIYFMSYGRRHHVPDQATLNAYGYVVGDEANIPMSTGYLLPKPVQQVSTIFKGIGPAIYLAEGGKRRHISSGEAYNTLGSPTTYSQQPVSGFSDFFVGSIAVGAPIFVEGQVVYNTTTGMYAIYESSTLRYASSQAIGKDWGLGAYNTSNASLDQLTTGTTIGRYITGPDNNNYLLDSGTKIVADASSNQHLALDSKSYSSVTTSTLSRIPSRTFKGLVQTPGLAKVYEAVDGELYHIFDRSVLTAKGYTYNDITPLSAGFISTLVNDGVSILTDGRVFRINGAAEIYVVDSNTKRHVTSRGLLQNYGWNIAQVVNVNTVTGNFYTTSTPLTNLVVNGSGDYWLFDSAKKRKIPTALVSSNPFGFTYTNATTLTTHNFNRLPTAPDLTDVLMDISNGKVYKIEEGAKRWYVSRESFEASNGDWNTVQAVSPSFVNSIPTGANIN